MIHVLSNGRYFDDISLLSEEERQDLKLLNEQTSLYNTRNEILRKLTDMAKALEYDNPKDYAWAKEQFKEVTSRYNEQIREIDKQHIKSDKQIMALIENGC